MKPKIKQHQHPKNRLHRPKNRRLQKNLPLLLLTPYSLLLTPYSLLLTPISLAFFLLQKSSMYFKTILLFYFLFFTGCGESLSTFHENQNHQPAQTEQTETSLKNPLILVAIDVDQGDATLIITPDDQTILIDTGKYGMGKTNILDVFQKLGVHHLNYLFITHYDADHMGATSEIVAGPDGVLGTQDDFTPDHVLDRGPFNAPDEPAYHYYEEAVGSLRTTVQPGDNFVFGNLKLTCVIANGATLETNSPLLDKNDENGRSLGLVLEFGSFRYFTGGDLPGGGASGNTLTRDMESLVAPFIGEVDMLHVNHHGSSTSSNLFFLETLNPNVSLVSVGENNVYGHPTAATLDHLHSIQTKIFLTHKGSGGFLPEAHIADGSIFVLVGENGSYEVNGFKFDSKND